MLQLVKVIMVVLGCHIYDIQQDRISTAISFAETLQQNSYLWFLTGGIKNAIINNIQSEAKQMMNQLNSSNIVLDETARNTAENFVNLKKWIINNYINMEKNPEIVITTSLFHKERANIIFNGIFNDTNIKPLWNLSPLTFIYCLHDERKHIKNVQSDINNALKL